MTLMHTNLADSPSFDSLLLLAGLTDFFFNSFPAIGQPNILKDWTIKNSIYPIRNTKQMIFGPIRWVQIFGMKKILFHTNWPCAQNTIFLH